VYASFVTVEVGVALPGPVFAATMVNNLLCHGIRDIRCPCSVYRYNFLLSMLQLHRYHC